MRDGSLVIKNKKLKKDRTMLKLGILVLLAFGVVFVAVFGQWFTPHDPYVQDLKQTLAAPSGEHLCCDRVWPGFIIPRYHRHTDHDFFCICFGGWHYLAGNDCWSHCRLCGRMGGYRFDADFRISSWLFQKWYSPLR